MTILRSKHCILIVSELRLIIDVFIFIHFYRWFLPPNRIYVRLMVAFFLAIKSILATDLFSFWSTHHSLLSVFFLIAYACVELNVVQFGMQVYLCILIVFFFFFSTTFNTTNHFNITIIRLCGYMSFLSDKLIWKEKKKSYDSSERQKCKMMPPLFKISWRRDISISVIT